MKFDQGQHIIKAWSFQNILMEFYRYAPCPPGQVPTHYHDEYQFCLSLDCPGEYYYRGTCYPVPTGSLSVIHPGEIHSARDTIDNRQTPATFRMMYVSSTVVNRAAVDVAESETNLPFFRNPIILDSSLARLYLDCHRASQNAASKLEQDSLLLSLLTQFIQRYADTISSARLIGRERASVRRVREYLQENYVENISLNQLAQIAELSPYYLSRVFRAEVGIALQHYQTQVRIDRAKIFLSQGMSAKQVAAETGFVDQSHLTHHFKRFVQVTPGKYYLRDRNNLQDLPNEVG